MEKRILHAFGYGIIEVQKEGYYEKTFYSD